MVKTSNGLKVIQEKLSRAKVISFDFETTSLHHKEMEIDGVSFEADTLDPVFLWARHEDLEYSRVEFFEFMQKAFSYDAVYVGHNLVFDIKVLDYFFKVRPKNIFDTMIASWYLDENRPKGLKYLGETFLGVEMQSYSSHLKEQKAERKDALLLEAERQLYEEFFDGKPPKITKKAIKERALELEAVTPIDNSWLEEYGALDAHVTYELYKVFAPLLEEEPDLNTLFFELEMPFVNVLVDMLLAGIHINIDLLKEMEKHFSEKQTRLEIEIYNSLGEFNLNSPNQLCEKLYGISVTRKAGKITLTDVRQKGVVYADPTVFTDKKVPSTSEAALESINTPTAELLREYRGTVKLLNTYAIGYQKFIFDGVLYPGFNHVGAVTGRLSSSEPNMQNLPASKTDGYFIRDAFISPEGYKLVVTDESQLELRLLAHCSGDPVLMEAFLSGKDIHYKTASDVLVKDIDDVTDEERRFFKTINFAIMYGMGAPALAENLNIPLEMANKLLKNYFQTYAGVPAFINRTNNTMRKNGFIRTLLGRKRRIPEINSRNKKEVFRAQRQTVNSKIQGSAADILKAAMIKISDEFKSKGLDAHILLQIHDELVCRVKDEHLDEACDIIRRHMEHPFDAELKVPLIAIPKIVESWGAVK